jgi:hypothetical protein
VVEHWSDISHVASCDLTSKRSCQIQKLLLEADNKLVIGTLDNIGFARCRTGDFEKALAVSRKTATRYIPSARRSLTSSARAL